jgi:hypothetical protein
MLTFRKLTPQDRDAFLERSDPEKILGCEYSFVNMCIWGRQRVCFLEDFIVIFSQYDRSTVYPFPMGSGNVKPVLDAIIHDARSRGIPCRLSSMTAADCALLESLYPGQFRFHTNRDNYDYVYGIRDLAELRGKRYQSKRNFVNRFYAAHPDCQILPLDDATMPATKTLVQKWYNERLTADPLADLCLEQVALERAFSHWEDLGLEGLVLMEGDAALAMAMGSFLSGNTFDIHFEKAISGADGAYAAINCAFARYLQEKYPQLQYLNREDDMGIPGLRKAKLSYHPDHLVAKYWARLWEDDDAH